MADGNLEQFTFLFRVNGKADEGHLLSWNEKCEDVLGHAKADVVGRAWHSRIVAGEYLQEVLGNLELIKKLGRGELVLPLEAAGGRRCCAFMHAVARPRTMTLVCLARTPLGPGSLGAGESVTDLSSGWPIIVDAVPGCGLAMFAARDLPGGKMVIEEEPFFTRPKPASLEGRTEWDDDWAAAFSRISEPLRFPEADASEEATPLLASVALVRNALGFVHAPPPVKEGVRSLYSPPLDMDHALVKVALQVARLCIARLPECKGMDERVLQGAILAVEVNTFEGGRVFNFLSRANHSCAPNAVFMSMRGKGGFKTLRPVKKGEELTISYLSHELIYSSEFRRRLLWRSKCFVCLCRRCSASADPLRDRPCVACAGDADAADGARWRVVQGGGVNCYSAPSTESKVLGVLEAEAVAGATGRAETTPEGDWVELEGGWVLNCRKHFKLMLPAALARPTRKAPTNTPGLLDRYLSGIAAALQNTSKLPPSDCWYGREGFDALRLPECARKLDGPPESVKFMRFEGDRWRCPHCGQEESAEALLKAERSLALAAQHAFNMDMSAHRVKGMSSGGPLSHVTFVSEAFMQQAMRLADEALALLGRRHWIWQLGILFKLDLDIALLKWSGGRWEMERSYVFHMTFVMASLLELWDWLASLDLSADPACWLYTRAEKLLGLVKKTSDATLEHLREALQKRAAGAVADTLGSREFLPKGLAATLAA